MFQADIEKVAREAKPMLELLRRELAVGQLSEPMTGSIHPQVFMPAEDPSETNQRVAFALGLTPAGWIGGAEIGVQGGAGFAFGALACKIRSAITGEAVEDLTYNPYTSIAPDGSVVVSPEVRAVLTDQQNAKIDEINGRLRKGESYVPGAEVRPMPLPEDFPGREELATAGITTYPEVHRISDSGTLTDIKGIGPATADKIQAALLPKTI